MSRPANAANAANAAAAADVARPDARPDGISTDMTCVASTCAPTCAGSAVTADLAAFAFSPVWSRAHVESRNVRDAASACGVAEVEATRARVAALEPLAHLFVPADAVGAAMLALRRHACGGGDVAGVLDAAATTAQPQPHALRCLVRAAVLLAHAGVLDLADQHRAFATLCARRRSDFALCALVRWRAMWACPRERALVAATPDAFFDAADVDVFDYVVSYFAATVLTPRHLTLVCVWASATPATLSDAVAEFRDVSDADLEAYIADVEPPVVAVAVPAAPPPPAPARKRARAEAAAAGAGTAAAPPTRARTPRHKAPKTKPGARCAKCASDAVCEVLGCSTTPSLVLATKGTPQALYFACCVETGHACKRCSVGVAQKTCSDRIKRVRYANGEDLHHVRMEWCAFEFCDLDTGLVHVIDATGSTVSCATLPALAAKRISPAGVKLFVATRDGATVRSYLRAGTANVWRVDVARVRVLRETVTRELCGARFAVRLWASQRRVECDATAKVFRLAVARTSLLEEGAGAGGDGLPPDTWSTSVVHKVLVDAATPRVAMTDEEFRATKASRADVAGRRVHATHLSIGTAARETQFRLVDGDGGVEVL